MLLPLFRAVANDGTNSTESAYTKSNGVIPSYFRTNAPIGYNQTVNSIV